MTDGVQRGARRTALMRAPAWALAAVLFVARSSALAQGAELFRLEDPRGDDNGAGTLTYPSRPDMQPGDLDLVAFSARAASDGTWFTVEFAHPIRDPAGEVTQLGQTPISSLARLGFYTFNVDVYIDTDRIFGSGHTETIPGRGVAIDRATAWEKCIVLTPRPDTARALLEREFVAQGEDETRERLGHVHRQDRDWIRERADASLDARYFFPTRVRVHGHSVDFFVPQDFLGGPASRHWAYAVLVTGADIEQYGRPGQLSPPVPTMFTMPVVRGITADAFGIRSDADEGTAPVVDLLAPGPGDQEKILNDYDTQKGRLAAVPGVAPDGSASMLRSGGAVTAEARREAEALVGKERGQPAGPAPASGPGHDAAAPAAAGAAPGTAGPQKPVTERLQQLNKLLSDGLITQAEYNELRRKILSEL
jgi:hypothetical protein